MDTVFRKKMVEAIQANPGVSQGQLAQCLAVHPSTILYHEKPLIKNRTISKIRFGRAVCYFPNGEKIPWETKSIRGVLQNPSKCRVVAVFLECPKISVSEAARQLNLGPSTLKRHADMLVKSGILVKCFHNRRVGLEINPIIMTEVQRFLQGTTNDEV